MAMRNAFVSADVDFLDGAIKDGDIDRGLSGACVVVAYVRRNVEGKNMVRRLLLDLIRLHTY